MHFLEFLAVRLNVDRDRLEKSRNARGGEQNVAEEFERRSSPRAAMAPMFQITRRPASRLVVTTRSRRPLRCSAAIAASMSASTRFSISRLSGQVSNRLSGVALSSNTSAAVISVRFLRSSSS